MYLIYSAGQQSITKTPMNLLDRLNGIYSAKSEVPINWLVAARRDALDLFPHFLRRSLLKRSTNRGGWNSKGALDAFSVGSIGAGRTATWDDELFFVIYRPLNGNMKAAQRFPWK